MGWKLITPDRYHEQLEMLPPALWLAKGFLSGDQWDSGVCKITEAVKPRYPAFVKVKGTHWENERPMTVDEFVAFNPNCDAWRALFSSVK